MRAPSLEELYREHGDQVYRRCRYLLGSEAGAWDATHEIFLKVDAAKDGFGGRSSWATWLCRIATNHCLNLLRSQKVRLGRGHADVGELEACGHGTVGTSEHALIVRRLLSHFDRKTQAMAIHYYVDEMSQHEVADAVGLSVPTVRKRLASFIRRARRELGVGSARVPPPKVGADDAA